VWSNDHESYAGDSVAIGKATHVSHVKGDDPDKNEYVTTENITRQCTTLL
jgi:hypothetical protein